MAVISFEIMENNRYGCYPRFYSKFFIADFVGWTCVLAQDMAVISNLWIFFIVEFFLADPTLRCGLEILTVQILIYGIASLKK